MTHNNLLIPLACAFIISLTAAAESPSALQRPLPESWQYAEALDQSLPSDDRWWAQFDDPVLDSLITMGENSNFDLAMAYRRMEAASRQMAIARAAYYPTVDLSAGYTRSREAEVNSNRWAALASASWQIDLFGKVTAGVRQKKALYRASRAEWVGSMVSMAGDIASTYVQLRVWQAELAVAREHCITQDSIAGLVKARFECGLGAKPQVDQALSLLYSTRASIPSLESSIRQAISTLALLTGRYPADIEGLLASHESFPDYRQLVATGVPSQLLRRRPDIVSAEYQLAAAAAAVGIAKKDFLPTLSLEGSVGVAAPKPGDMFTRSGFTYSIAPTLSWTLFDGFARRASVMAAREEMEAQIANYNYTVMNAYNEVDNAIIAYINYTRQIDEYTRARDAANEFLTLSLDLYTQGLSPYSDVATAQQNLLSYTNSLIVARGNALTSLITLYEALGGGFSEYNLNE